MLECRCSNLSKTFFYASFSSILSNSPLNPISNSTIFAWLTSTFIVSAFNSLENFFEIFNIIFYSNFILFTILLSAVAFPLFFGLCWQNYTLTFLSIVHSFSLCWKNGQRFSIYAKAYLLLSLSYVRDAGLWVLKGCYVFVSEKIMANFRDPSEKYVKPSVTAIVILVKLLCTIKV